MWVDLKKTSQFSRFNFHLSGFESVLLWLIWNLMPHLGGKETLRMTAVDLQWRKWEISKRMREPCSTEWMSNSLHYYWLCLGRLL